MKNGFGINNDLIIFNTWTNKKHKIMEYYIISLKHTSKGDTALTFWGANRSGYTWDKNRAGLYSHNEAFMLSDELNVAVQKDIVDRFWQDANDFGDKYTSVPNNSTTLYMLGLKSSLMKPKKFASCRIKFLLPETV
jgi:hypothetical protein